MSHPTQREKKQTALVWITAGVLTLATVGMALWLTGPPPPKQIVIGTGTAGGAYDAFGQQYKARLDKMGLKVVIVNTNGAEDNLRRLARGEIDVAFTQGGLAKSVEDPKGDLRGLAALYLEPLWVFTRSSLGVHELSGLKGRTLSIGPALSGTEAVARPLLAAHGVDASDTRLINQTGADAEKALATGSLDALLVVSSPSSVLVQNLLRKPELTLMDFNAQGMAHTRLFPFLQPVKVFAGLIDLRQNIPAEDKTLLAPAAILVCRQNLHSQVVEEVYKVITDIHSKGDLISPPHTFPTLQGVDFPIHETAEAYARSGESFMARVLPYWAVRWVWRLRILLVPLLAVWIPVLKILPKVYEFWTGRQVKRRYRELRDLEIAVARTSDPLEMRGHIADLAKLRQSLWDGSRHVPIRLQPQVYQWRIHVAEVHAEAREKLLQLQEADDKTGASP